ncbi:MAG: Fe-S cluster assembly protein SufD [Pseudomonadota bacterium]
MSDLADLARVSAGIGPDALSELRARAAEQFARDGFPTTRAEDWKYTDLKLARSVTLDALSSQDAEPSGQAELPDIDAHWFVIGNGRPVAPSDARPGGAEVSLLSEANLDLRYDLPLSDLNLALLSDGLHIRVPAGVDVEKPLGLLFIDSSSGRPLAVQGRVIVDVERGARVSLIELHRSEGSGTVFANNLLELNIADAAQVAHVRLQTRDREHAHTARLLVSCGRDAQFRHFGLDCGGKLARNDLAVDLSHTGADVEFNGLFLVDQGQHVDNHTSVDHRVGPATSRQEYRGIIRGRAVWNGKAIVHEGADGTDATQANHNLLLSPGADVNAKPELEIYAEDVKCAHGTTVGQLDDSAVFYLRSRGLDTEQARQLMTQAFAGAVASSNPVAECQALVDETIERSLDALLSRGDR